MNSIPKQYWTGDGQSMDRCSCLSYNWDIGTVPNVMLPAPSWSSQESICIDACIADAILALWDEGIQTGASCCGHGGFVPDWIDGAVPHGPEVIVMDNEDAELAARVLRRVDQSRHWKVLQWQLTMAAQT